MRFIIGLGVLLAWLAFMGVSAVSNVSLAVSWATTDQEWYVLAGAALAADAIKAFMPVALIVAVSRKAWHAAIAAVALFIVCQAFAGMAALSFASKTRTAFGDAQEIAASDRLKIEDKRAKAKDDLSWLPSARPVSVVEAELTKFEAEDRFKGSVGCTAPRSSYDTKFCRVVFTLRQEIETARNRDILSKRIDDFDAKLAGMANLSGDVQLAAVVELTGADPKKVIAVLAALVAVMVELGSALGLTVATALFVKDRQVKAVEAAPVPQAQPVAALQPVPAAKPAVEPSRRLAARLQPLAA